MVIPDERSMYSYTSFSNRIEFNVNGYSFKTDPYNASLALFVSNNWPQPNVIDHIEYISFNNISPFSQVADIKTTIWFSLTDGNHHSAISNTNIPLSFNPNNWDVKNFTVEGRKPNGDFAYYIVCSIIEMK